MNLFNVLAGKSAEFWQGVGDMFRWLWNDATIQQVMLIIAGYSILENTLKIIFRTVSRIIRSRKISLCKKKDNGSVSIKVDAPETPTITTTNQEGETKNEN